MQKVTSRDTLTYRKITDKPQGGKEEKKEGVEAAGDATSTLEQISQGKYTFSSISWERYISYFPESINHFYQYEHVVNKILG